MRSVSALTAVLMIASARNAPAQGFAEVAELARAGRYAAAYELALALADPLTSDQARVHALWAGGDLVGALHACDAGLARASEDTYLLEQACSLASALGAHERAAAYLERLRARPDATIGPRLAGLEQEVVSGLALAQARARGLARARSLTLAVGGLVVLALLLPRRWRGAGKLQSRSSTPFPSKGS